MKTRETLQIGTLTKDVADKIQNCKVTNMQIMHFASQIWLDSSHWRIKIVSRQTVKYSSKTLEILMRSLFLLQMAFFWHIKLLIICKNFIAGDTAEHVNKDVADNILIGTLNKDVADKN